MFQAHAGPPRIEQRQGLQVRDVPRESVDYYLYLGTWEADKRLAAVLTETRDPIFGYIVHPKDHFYSSTAAVIPLGQCSQAQALKTKRDRFPDAIVVGCHQFDEKGDIVPEPRCWLVIEEVVSITTI